MKTPPIPIGFGVVVDPWTRRLDDANLFGGSPARVLRLTDAGQRAYAELEAGTVTSRAGAALARRLTDAGLMHPRPPARTETFDATVIVPVRDRPEELDRCLSALGGEYPVLVVDDASADPSATAAVATRHGAKIVHRPVNGGAGAARNTGLAEVRSEFVVFLDSDTVPTEGWIDGLATHFADPAMAAVAPRIVQLHKGHTAVDRYTEVAGSLDLGDREARVTPVTRVAYVPTAALVARRAALLAVARDGDVFDPAMRHGEDVDLVWRLDKAGWRVRYEPGVQVRHDEPVDWSTLLRRRYRYGTSAIQLAERHPTSIPHLVLHPASAVTVAAALARRPVLAGLAFAGSVVAMNRTLRRSGVPTKGVVPAMARAAHQTWLGVGHYGVQFGAPLLAAAIAAPRLPGERHPGWRRLAATSLLLGPALERWRTSRPRLDPVRFTAASLADDVMYGAGVWSAALKARNFVAQRPRIARRTVTIEGRQP